MILGVRSLIGVPSSFRDERKVMMEHTIRPLVSSSRQLFS
jgi:hypothetical protein